MYEDILKAVWFTPGPKHRWGLPMLFEGRPGTAKTSVIEAAARNVDLSPRVVLGSVREPSDFVGLPSIGRDGEMAVTEYAVPDWAHAVSKAKRAVVAFDEINTAAPSTQAALLRVVLEGVVGEFRLPDTIRFVAMMNATDEAAGGWDLAAPLANRFGHWKWDVPAADEWGDWLLSSANGGDGKASIKAEAEEKRVLEAWDNPFAKARGLVAGFVRRRPELLHKQPDVGDPKASKAWPSPRTWEYAARALAGAEVHGLDDMNTSKLLSAFIGEGAASEFEGWREQQDLPDPADVLDGKVTFAHDVKRMDRTVAVLSSCAAYLTGPNTTKKVERGEVLWKLLGEIMGSAADVIVPAARALVRARLATAPAARKVLMRLQPVLEAAGLISTDKV